LRVQKTIEENLNHFFPTLQIRGEEDSKDYKDLPAGCKPGDLKKDFISEERLLKRQAARKEWLASCTDYADEVVAHPFDKFNTKDAVVWIDPLDGTSDFVKGNLSAVTCIIGLSIGGHSKLGVVHNVYAEDD